MGGGEVLKKGWLVKSPPLEGGGMKSWRKRFFLLRSSKILEYYKTESGEIKGVVNLEDCVSVHADLFHKKYKHVFDIQTKDRVYYLVAPSADEMEMWVAALCKLCGFTSEELVIKTPRTASTLPGNYSVTRTPLPEPPSTQSKYSTDMERYMLSPEVIELLRCKPSQPLPSTLSVQDAMCSNSPKLLRTSTGSSIESLSVSQRSSQEPENFSTRFSSSSIDGIPDHGIYNTPTNNQPANIPVNVPSHYDVPRSALSVPPSSNVGTGNRAQMLSNNYMVPRLARMSDPLNNYDFLPPPRRATVPELPSYYDYLPRRDPFLPPRADLPLPPRSELPLPPRSGTNIYDVPPHPRPLVHRSSLDSSIHSTPNPINFNNTFPLPTSVDTIDCPTPQQGNLLPPPILSQKEASTGHENDSEEMIRNKMYDMVWAEHFPDKEPGSELEETLTNEDENLNKPHYVNLAVIDEAPPPVDRSLKPGAPPKVDRSNKPKGTISDEMSPEHCEETFSPKEVPRLTTHSVHYTQVSFDRRRPVPTPRSNFTPSSSPQRRVNYCHIDIDATSKSMGQLEVTTPPVESSD